MTIVGVNVERSSSKKSKKDPVEKKEELTVEERREIAKENRKPEPFSGKDLLTDGHYQKIITKKQRSSRRATILDSLKSIYEQSQDTPLQTKKISEDKDMLRVYHRSMAGKTKVVGTAVFVFDKNGIAKIGRANLPAYQLLIKQPGYSAWPRPAVKKVVPAEPVLVSVTVVEPPVEAAEEVEEVLVGNGLLEPSAEEEVEVAADDDDEYFIPDEINFSKYKKAELQKALKDASVEFDDTDWKSVLITKLDEAWLDDDLQEIIFDSLNPEED